MPEPIRTDHPEYLEYPRLLYKAGEEPIAVKNDDQKAAALAEGFALTEADAADAAKPKAKK